MHRIYPLEELNAIYPLEGTKHIGQSMIPAKLTVSGFEDLLTVPAYVLFSGPQVFQCFNTNQTNQRTIEMEVVTSECALGVVDSCSERGESKN